MMRIRKRMIMAFALVLLFSGNRTVGGEGFERKLISKKFIGQIDLEQWDNASLVISPDGNRGAFLRRYSKLVVQLIDKGTKNVDEVFGNRLWFTRDTNELRYLARNGEQWFSVADLNEIQFPGRICRDTILATCPQGRRWAFIVKDGDDELAIVDGAVEGRYKQVTDPIFSADSKRLGYRVVTRDDPPQEAAVIDGKMEKKWTWVAAESLRFSPDGMKFAYIASDGRNHFIIANNKVLGSKFAKLKADMLRFSPDGKDVYCVAVDDKGSESIAVNGLKRTADFAGVYSIFFSNDGKHAAWIVDNKCRWELFKDGMSYQTQDRIFNKQALFSPDGSKIAFPAMPKAVDVFFYSINKVDGKKYFDISQLVFSPDGGHYAYFAKTGNDQWAAVRDGIETFPFYNFFGDSMKFTPDGKGWAFIATDKDGESFAVINGEKGKSYKTIWIGDHSFSAEGRHFLYRARCEKGSTIVVDKAEGEFYPDIWSLNVNNTSGTRFRYIVLERCNCYLVEEEIVEE